MNRLFTARDSDFLKVPDGTLVNPFLDPMDAMSGLPSELVDGPSVAAGQIDPRVVSEIHVMPSAPTRWHCPAGRATQPA